MKKERKMYLVKSFGNDKRGRRLGMQHGGWRDELGRFFGVGVIDVFFRKTGAFTLKTK